MEKSKRAIVHFDGDAFFASVEQAKNYKLRGKCVVTGGERGIAASFSYEAKARGVRRGMNMGEIKKICPEAIILPSDYEMYAIFARRMYELVRRWTPIVEEYSIDECFADITGLDKALNKPYEAIVADIKHDLEMRLGITFGVGLAPNKVLAKVASKHKKPAGLTHISLEKIDEFLKDLPIHKVWGIGGAMSMQLRQLGVETAHDFASKSEAWLREHHIAKPYKEIWYEFKGYLVKPIDTEGRQEIGSIVKSRTFSPSSMDREFIFSQLSKNIELACEKARYYGVSAGAITFMLKTQEFRYRSYELTLPVPTASATEIIKIVKQYFDKIYKPGILYRATGITLRSIRTHEAITYDLFGQSTENEKSEKVFEAVDQINQKWGSETMMLGSSFRAFHHEEKRELKVVEKRFNIPLLGYAKC